MSDRYGLQESANRIRAIVPSGVELTDDHRAILGASSKLIHMSALVEMQAQKIESQRVEIEQLRKTFGHRHVAGYPVDRCGSCGLDIRNPIHHRETTKDSHPTVVPINDGEYYECSKCHEELIPDQRDNGLRLECGNCGAEWWEYEPILPEQECGHAPHLWKDAKTCGCGKPLSEILTEKGCN